MFRTTLSFALFAFTAACAGAPKDVDVQAKAPELTEEQMMQRMTELGQPGPAHKRLDPLVGKFGAKMSMWMSADAPEQTWEGTCTNEWIFDGRFVQQKIDGVVFGQPFSGLGITGFDNFSQKYQGIWVDSMGTIMMPIAIGTPNSNGKVITFTRTMVDPILNKEVTTREVLTIVDENRHTFEWYQPGKDGKEFRMMRAEYVRAR